MMFSVPSFSFVRLASSHQTELAFVFGNARVAPMRALSNPKLELQAALLATRLKEEILKGLPPLISGITYLAVITQLIPVHEGFLRKPSRKAAGLMALVY